MHRIEAMALAQEIVRRLGRAADARQLGDLVRLDIEFETGLDDGERNRVMTATGAKRGNRTFIVAMGETEPVHGNARMAQLGLGDIGHSAASWDESDRRSAMAALMKRAVMGVPSKCRTETKRAGSMPHSLTNRLRIWASRFCSTRKIWS